jgi:hypothetical protein
MSIQRMIGAAALSGIAGDKVSAILRNKDGSVNWRLISIIGLSVAVLATAMSYRQEKTGNGATTSH